MIYPTYCVDMMAWICLITAYLSNVYAPYLKDKHYLEYLATHDRFLSPPIQQHFHIFLSLSHLSENLTAQQRITCTVHQNIIVQNTKPKT